MPYSFQQTLTPVVRGQPPQKVNALLLAEKEWNQLNYDLAWKQHEADAMAASLAHRKGIKNTSDYLKRNWRDTVVNIRQNQLDAREARVQADLAERTERFHQMQRDKAEEKRVYLEACKLVMFYTKDSVHALNSAMIFSEVLRERAVQVEFEKKLQAIEVQREADYAARVKKDVEDYQREEHEKTEAKARRAKSYQSVLLAELHDRETKAKAEKEMKERLEREDMENLNKEIANGKLLEQEAQQSLSVDIRKIVTDAIDSRAKFKIAKQVEDDEEDRVLAVYVEAKKRILTLCKKKEKEIQDEALRQRDRIRTKLGSDANAKLANDESRLTNAVAKREAEEEKVRLEKIEYEKRMVKERKEDHHEYMEAEERRKEEERQMKKWDMMQRFRTEEVNEQHALHLQQVREENVRVRREGLAEQIAQTAAMYDGQREEDLYAMEQAHRKKEDDAFFKYADEVIEDSKKVGRPLFPIEKEIHMYRARNSLLPRKTTPDHMYTSTIPFGRAKDPSHIPVNPNRIPVKRSRVRQKRPITVPDGECHCGPILCSCPLAAPPADDKPTSPGGQCICGPIVCNCQLVETK